MHIFLLQSQKIYPTKTKKSIVFTVAFHIFLENINKFSYSIYTDLKCANWTMYPMNFTHLNSKHFPIFLQSLFILAVPVGKDSAKSSQQGVIKLQLPKKAS